jgi:hypothetical protein
VKARFGPADRNHGRGAAYVALPNMWKSYESAAVCSGVRRLSSISLASFPSSPLWMRSEKDDAAIKMSFTRFRGKRNKIFVHFSHNRKKRAQSRRPKSMHAHTDRLMLRDVQLFVDFDFDPSTKHSIWAALPASKLPPMPRLFSH